MFHFSCLPAVLGRDGKWARQKQNTEEKFHLTEFFTEVNPFFKTFLEKVTVSVKKTGSAGYTVQTTAGEWAIFASRRESIFEEAALNPV